MQPSIIGRCNNDPVLGLGAGRAPPTLPRLNLLAMVFGESSFPIDPLLSPAVPIVQSWISSGAVFLSTVSKSTRSMPTDSFLDHIEGQVLGLLSLLKGGATSGLLINSLPTPVIDGQLSSNQDLILPRKLLGPSYSSKATRSSSDLKLLGPSYCVGFVATVIQEVKEDVSPRYTISLLLLVCLESSDVLICLILIGIHQLELGVVSFVSPLMLFLWNLASGFSHGRLIGEQWLIRAPLICRIPRGRTLFSSPEQRLTMWGSWSTTSLSSMMQSSVVDSLSMNHALLPLKGDDGFCIDIDNFDPIVIATCPIGDGLLAYSLAV